MRFLLRILLSIAVVWAIYFCRTNELMLYYPLLIVTLVFCTFVYSLFHTPIAEVCARRMGERLDAQGVAYCRKATIAWTIFLGCHWVVTAMTIFSSREVWALYNGGIAYVLMGLMFAGEWLVRRRVRHG